MTRVRRLAGLGLLLVLAGCASDGFTPVRTAFNRGVHHLSERDYASAVHEFRIALREHPDDLQARFNLAFALESLARLPGSEAPEFAAEAESHYRAILERRPGHLRAAVNLAARAWAAGRAEEADALLAGAESAHPRSARPSALRAVHALEGGELEAATEHATRAVARDPGDPGARAVAGRVAAATGDRAAARRHYEVLLSSHPDDVAALLWLGEDALEAGRPAAARARFRRAVLANPFAPGARRALSRAAEALGDHRTALRQLAEARRLEATRPEAWRSPPPSPADDRARERRLLEARLAALDAEDAP